MLLSRGAVLLRNVRHLRAVKSAVPNVAQKRLSHIIRYREAFDAPRSYQIISEFLGGFFWWWVLWHLYHQSDHILGEWDVPTPENWTDEELGIPPDDE